VITEGEKPREDHLKSSNPVIYNYHYRLVPLSSNVLSVVERLLECNYRSNGKESQVDPRVFATLLEDLVDYLGLTASFNLFVMNPRKSWAKNGFCSTTLRVYSTVKISHTK